MISSRGTNETCCSGADSRRYNHQTSLPVGNCEILQRYLWGKPEHEKLWEPGESYSRWFWSSFWSPAKNSKTLKAMVVWYMWGSVSSVTGRRVKPAENHPSAPGSLEAGFVCRSDFCGKLLQQVVTFWFLVLLMFYQLSQPDCFIN